MQRKLVFETERLVVERPQPDQEAVELFYALWTDPRVMANVGFPRGLPTSRDDIQRRLQDESQKDQDGKDQSPLSRLLLVRLKENGQPIGEAWLGRPDSDRISDTDIKLLPEFWGKGYGVEIKRGLVRFLFEYTDCQAVRATPNEKNLASIRMQEAVGGKRVGEFVSEFPPEMQAYTETVRGYVYLVYRQDREAW